MKAIILAGGYATRLRPLTVNRAGISIPKQYCSLEAGPSLLREALQRAFTLVPRRRTSVVVAEQHAAWWSPLARELPVVNIAVGSALFLTGPGRYSLDRAFGIRVPRWLSALTMLGSAALLVVGLLSEAESPPADDAE